MVGLGPSSHQLDQLENLDWFIKFFELNLISLVFYSSCSGELSVMPISGVSLVVSNVTVLNVSVSYVLIPSVTSLSVTEVFGRSFSPRASIVFLLKEIAFGRTSLYSNK